MRWKSFWDGLNIRKLMVLIVFNIFIFNAIISVLIGGVLEINQTVKEFVIICTGYYFGYSNGKTPDEKCIQKEQVM